MVDRIFQIYLKYQADLLIEWQVSDKLTLKKLAQYKIVLILSLSSFYYLL